jgi:B12-binding domain/radical SAM domain protein
VKKESVVHLQSKTSKTQICVLSPKFYTYGALKIAGCLDSDFNVELTKGELKPADILCLTLTATSQLFSMQKTIENARKIYKKIIIGGPICLDPTLVFNQLNPDFITTGEGEEVIVDLLNNLDKPEAVNGIGYKENDEIIITKPAKSPEFTDKLLIPSDLKKQVVRGVNLYLETHRGRTGNCTFCAVPKIFGREIRKKPMELILSEIRKLKENGAGKLAISGGTALQYGSEFSQLLSEISSIIGKDNFAAPDLRVDSTNEETLSAIKNYTTGWVAYGIESGSQRVLNAMKKGTIIDQVKTAVELAKQAEVDAVGSFIAGFPSETNEEYSQTIELIKELKLDDIYCGVAIPVIGTESFENCIRNELVDNGGMEKRLREIILLNMEMQSEVNEKNLNENVSAQMKYIKELCGNLKTVI